MFCRNCGAELQDNDLFCTNCGAKTEVTSSQPVKISTPNAGELLNHFKSYYTNTSEFYTTIKKSEKFKVSGLFFLYVVFFASIINVLCKFSIINRISRQAKQYAEEVLGGSGLSGIANMLDGRSNLINSSSIRTAVKSTINSAVPTGKIITTTIIITLLMVILMAAVLEILNFTLFKQQILHEDIALISTTSLAPSIFVGILSALMFNFSLFLGLFLMLLGSALIFIRMYTGLTKLTSIDHNKIYLVLIIMIFVTAVIFAICVNSQIGSFTNTAIKGLIHDLL